MLSEVICRYLYLLHAYFSARFNAEKQFLVAQNRCMKECLARHGVDYPVLAPEEKKELLRLGALLDHKVKDLFVVNTWSTYRRWLRIERNGGEPRKPGRRRTISERICHLVVRMAKENADWGLRRIAGEIRKLGASISGPSVKAILKRHGIEPPPRKGRGGRNGSWRKFIDAHMDTTVAVDFFTCKVLTLKGVFLAHSLVFLHHASRRVWISWPTLTPDEDWNVRQLKGAFWWPVPGRHSQCRVYGISSVFARLRLDFNPLAAKALDSRRVLRERGSGNGCPARTGEIR